MRKTARSALTWVTIASLGGTSLLAVPGIAAANMLSPGFSKVGAEIAAPADEVQYYPRPRPGWRPGPGYGPRPGWRPPPPGYHARWGNPYWRNNGWYYRNNNNGAWIAAGIAGAALGAAGIGAANAQANQGAGADEVAYCARRFKSYDPRTGTYLSTDGNRYPCP